MYAIFCGRGMKSTRVRCTEFSTLSALFSFLQKSTLCAHHTRACSTGRICISISHTCLVHNQIPAALCTNHTSPVQYRIGQLYMIARHSAEQSKGGGDGVEVVVNEPCHDDRHGDGQYTEKRIYLTK